MARKTSKRVKKAAPDLGSAKAKYQAHYNAGRFDQALAVTVQLMKRGVSHPVVYADAAAAAIYLNRWADAAGYADKALALDPSNLCAADAASHAAGMMKQWEKTAKMGRIALDLRDRMVPQAPPLDLPLANPAQGAQKDIIAFSLFGGNSKYCETAILNCVEQPRIYPDWLCRFYVDSTVPDAVKTRLTAAGGEVIIVKDDVAKWPGPMWRFAAYDTKDARRVIFRDADSVISKREASAVQEWISRDTNFHIMRDVCTHTELILAGLWGVKKGALPLMSDLVADFLKTPVQDAHFADQLFLRNYVWPYARPSITHHDSVFGFMDGVPFPDGPRRDDFHVGFAEGAMIMSIKSSHPDSTTVHWALIDQRGDAPHEVCRYAATVQGGAVVANIPARYGQLINSQDMIVKLLM